MRTRSRLRQAFAIAVALAVGRASADSEPGVCVAISGDEHADVARAARRALGVAARIDVRDASQRAALATRCARLVVAVGSEALAATEDAAPRAPLVHAMAANGRASGRPGVLPDADPRRVLETLQKLSPSARRIGAVYDPDLTGELVAEAEASARELGMELVALPVHTAGEAVRAFHRFETELRVDALWLLPDGTATVQETVYYAFELAHWRRIGIIGPSRWYVATGALFALVPTAESVGAMAGELGQQLLRGDSPPRAVHARDHALYVNQRAAARLGLKVPRQVLDAADEVLP